MDNTLTRPKKSDLITAWYIDCKDEQSYGRPFTRLGQAPRRAQERRRDGTAPTLHRIALRRAARMVLRRRDLMEHAESLTYELNVPLERVYFLAIVAFFEKYEENLKEHADASYAANSYREAGGCTEEEFNAVLEADERLAHELADLYKDSLED